MDIYQPVNRHAEHFQEIGIVGNVRFPQFAGLVKFPVLNCEIHMIPLRGQFG